MPVAHHRYLQWGLALVILHIDACADVIQVAARGVRRLQKTKLGPRLCDAKRGERVYILWTRLEANGTNRVVVGDRIWYVNDIVAARGGIYSVYSLWVLTLLVRPA